MIDIVVGIDHVEIEGKRVERPSWVPRSQWLATWEAFKWSGTWGRCALSRKNEHR